MAEINDENFEKIIEELEAEEKTTTATSVDSVDSVEANEEVIEKKPESSDEGRYYAHLVIMKDEGLTKADLPSDIKDMVASFNRQKNLAEKRGYGESTFIKIQNLSTLIADRIMDFLEKDIKNSPEVKKEEGGSVEGAAEGSGSEEVIKEEESEEILGSPDEEIIEDKKEEGGGSIFGGILGGVLDW